MQMLNVSDFSDSNKKGGPSESMSRKTALFEEPTYLGCIHFGPPR